MTESKILRSRNETVSLTTLEKVLPIECYQAVCDSFEKDLHRLGNELYKAYFTAIPEPPITDTEKEELFEAIGSDLVKVHYSTQQLRSFIQKEPTNKKRRNE
jgi:vacuolar-type H+-ATPase subunit C/Vma6